MIRVPLASCTAPSVIALFEHIIRRWIQHPVAAFARTIDRSVITTATATVCCSVACDFDETIVQWQIVSNRILPALFVVTIIGKSVWKRHFHLFINFFWIRQSHLPIHNKFINSTECESLIRCTADGHRNQCDVRKLWFLRAICALEQWEWQRPQFGNGR